MKKIFARKDPLLTSLGGVVAGSAAASMASSLSSATAASSAATPATPMPQVPWTVGRYTVMAEDVIAEGGFGVVFLAKGFLAKEPGEKKLYALKRMFVNNERDLAVCKREIAIVSNLNGHPNLIGFVDSSVAMLDGGIHEVLLLMPFHRTTVLQMMNDRIDEGFTEKEILLIFCDICKAVSRLHHCQTPIIHRDLKVENILRSDKGHYVLCDFGSATAKVLDPSKLGVAVVEEEIGKYTTLAYRAPEMVDLYQGKPLTCKQDIWALGCLLYKLSYFCLPFGESTLAITSAKLTFPDHKRKYSTNLKKLMRYLLTPCPDTRPDIFQASSLAFELSGLSTPIQNLNKVLVPTFDSISLSPSPPPAVPAAGGLAVATSAPTSQTAGASSPASASLLPVAPTDGSGVDMGGGGAAVSGTSVAPRQRPRGNAPVPGTQIQFRVPMTQTDDKKTKADPGQVSRNPFMSGLLASAKQDVPQSSGTSSTNPFMPDFVDRPEDDAATNKGWNPFSDSASFNQLNEDALYDQEFDSLRLGSESRPGDPFQSAPFKATDSGRN